MDFCRFSHRICSTAKTGKLYRFRQIFCDRFCRRRECASCPVRSFRFLASVLKTILRTAFPICLLPRWTIWKQCRLCYARFVFPLAYSLQFCLPVLKCKFNVTAFKLLYRDRYLEYLVPLWFIFMVINYGFEFVKSFHSTPHINNTLRNLKKKKKFHSHLSTLFELSSTKNGFELYSRE